MVQSDYTNIRISKDLREMLNQIGKKSETYDAIIFRIMKDYNRGAEE